MRGHLRPPGEGAPEAAGHGQQPASGRRLRLSDPRHPPGAGTTETGATSEGCTGTPTARLTSNDDSNSSTKVLFDGLGAPGAACRSEAWPGSPGGGGGGPGGCPENIPPIDPAMSAIAGGGATGPACAAGSRGGRGHVTGGAPPDPPRGV